MALEEHEATIEKKRLEDKRRTKKAKEDAIMMGTSKGRAVFIVETLRETIEKLRDEHPELIEPPKQKLIAA